MSVPYDGIVERGHGTYGFIRDRSWQRLFVAGADCEGGIPERGTLVSFVVDGSDPRGPRACQVRVVADPMPDVEIECSDCGDVLALSGADQAWFTFRGFPLPSRCRPCREARRPDRPRGPVHHSMEGNR